MMYHIGPMTAVSATTQRMMVPIARKNHDGVNATNMMLPKTKVIIAKFIYSLFIQVLCAISDQNSSLKNPAKSKT